LVYDTAFLANLDTFLRSLPQLPAGLEWTAEPTPTAFTLRVVPEPGTLVLLATGVLGLLLVWRRRRHTP
jgi:hypothetical protein